MTIEELWADYQYYTQELTKHSRQLAFAGAAICWALRTSNFTFPKLIYCSLGLIVIFFFLDILHYGISAILLYKFTRSEELKMYEKYGKIEENVDKPIWVDQPAAVLAITKMLVLLLSFLCLCVEFCWRISNTTVQ